MYRSYTVGGTDTELPSPSKSSLLCRHGKVSKMQVLFLKRYVHTMTNATFDQPEPFMSLIPMTIRSQYDKHDL
ncbi:hypothetical protein Naga_100764g2 [Nannochloropsis gaditana]|uniref:Uncharacterized protein n=1 Tax=Nannochloropsis gaditana TaxID=72520 RepID=W7T939_9STRA|nr:hypothetical protein Naga_100764g2 [Nannochloropsis gaditana]